MLSQIKQDEKLKAIPVLVFTTSNHEADVRDCYECRRKQLYPKAGSSWLLSNKALQCLKEFWFEVCILPPRT